MSEIFNTNIFLGVTSMGESHIPSQRFMNSSGQKQLSRCSKKSNMKTDIGLASVMNFEDNFIRMIIPVLFVELKLCDFSVFCLAEKYSSALCFQTTLYLFFHKWDGPSFAPIQNKRLINSHYYLLSLFLASTMKASDFVWGNHHQVIVNVYTLWCLLCAQLEREKLRVQMVMQYQETKSQEHHSILARHKIIEDRKEYLERLNTVRVGTEA